MYLELSSTRKSVKINSRVYGLLGRDKEGKFMSCTEDLPRLLLKKLKKSTSSCMCTWINERL